ncbi:MAG: hypothetical protein JW965_04435 [Bacteroidales bacterium]|nr:hypothetical protein [Bacteroidales bacterium]
MPARINTALVFLLLNSALLSAQQKVPENLILIQGVVMDANSLEALPNAHFILNKIFANVTDEKGGFAVYMAKNDTLRFTYIGYRDYIFTPSDTLTGKVYMAGIFLQTDTTAIGEVIVVPLLPDLRTGILMESPSVDPELINARNNIAASVYEGIYGQERLGVPSANYDILKRRQISDAYEKGAIPSDRMVGLNFLTIPAAILYFSKGLPERPEPPKPMIPQKDVERMKELYRNKINK